MKTQEIRIRVNKTGDSGFGGDGLKLCIYAVRWSLAEVIPAGFRREGNLADGTMVLSRDDHPSKKRGEYSVTRVTGCPTGLEYDYVCLPLDLIGFPVIEPMVPFSSQARVGDDRIEFEMVSAWEFIPRRFRNNLGVERIRDALRAAQGDIRAVENQMGALARKSLEAARRGVDTVYSPQIEFLRMVEQMVSR